MDMEFVESLRMSKRKEYMKLSELSDLTEQLAQATDRRDEVSAKMLVAMRQQPLLELHEIEETSARACCTRRRRMRSASAP